MYACTASKLARLTIWARFEMLFRQLRCTAEHTRRTVRTRQSDGTASVYASLLTFAKLRTSSVSRWATTESFISVGRECQGSGTVALWTEAMFTAASDGAG